MKRKFLAGAVVALGVSLISFSTLAYFTYEDSATNYITSGNIRIELEEYALNEEGQTVPYEQSAGGIGVMPGETVSKIVEVKNTGDNNAYIRVSVDKFINLADGTEGTADTGLVTMDFNSSDWTKSGEYYYYNTPVVPGEITAPLFNKVVFDGEMGNMYQNSNLRINIDAQATQVKNNGTDVFTAAGWPA